MKAYGLRIGKYEAPCIIMALCLLVCGCSGIERVPDAPIVHNQAYDIWPDSIDLHNGVILRAFGDSMLQVRVEGNVLRCIRVPSPASRSAYAFESEYPVLDALFRYESSIPDSVSVRFLQPYEIYLNPLAAHSGMERLGERVKNGFIVPVEPGRYSWPVVNDNHAWLLAACELFKVSGNRRWLETIATVAANVVGEDCRVARSTVTGLFHGIPRYLASASDIFPSWMGPSDLFGVHSFGMNAGYWCALNSLNSITSGMARKNERSRLPELPVDADSLRHLINREFWMPNTGMYSGMLYGAPPGGLPLQSSDNLAQALAVMAGMPGQHMADAIMEKTPVTPAGIAPFTPAPGSGAGTMPTSALTGSAWAIAAARAGNGEVYQIALGGLLHSMAHALLDSSRSMAPFRGTLTGVVVRGFFGMDFAFDGIYFMPSVPEGVPGEKKLTGLRYRKSILDITLHGTGSAISSFTIDGENADPFVPSHLEGRHAVDIVLDGAAVGGSVTVDDEVTALPAAPVVEWTSDLTATILPPGAGDMSGKRGNGACVQAGVPVEYGNFVYLNGVLTDDMITHSYRLYNAAKATSVQIVSVRDNRYASFSSKPHLYVPKGMQSIIHLANVARVGTRIVQDKHVAARFVESDRHKNRVLNFEYDAPREGFYLVDVHYISGLGIVNSRRRTALRTLTVNGSLGGFFVMPQLSPKSWDKDMGAGWQTLASYSNALKVHLHAGRNTMQLKFYQPSPVYVDPTANTILADFIRIVEL